MFTSLVMRPILLAGLLSLMILPGVKAQCTLIVDGDPAIQRSGPNQSTGTATLFPAQAIQGNWSVTFDGSPSLHTDQWL